MRNARSSEPQDSQQRRPGVASEMPGHRELSELLRASEERTRLAADAGALGLWTWDPDADCVALENDRAYEIFGLTPSGEPVNAACLVSAYMHESDVGGFERAAATTLHTGVPFHFQGRIYRRPDRALRWIELNGRLQSARDGHPAQIVGTTADITLLKEAEERERRAVAAAVAAAEASAKFRTFFEQGSSFAGVLSLDGTVLEVNRLALEACGFTREQIVGKKFWECAWWSPSPELVKKVRKGYRQAVEGRLYRRETAYFLADGSERVVEMTLTPVRDEERRVLFVAATGIDITEREEADRNLQRLTGSLAEANRKKTEFLAVLAHELRNPLAPIRNGFQLMRLASDDPTIIARVTDMVERQIAQMVRLIDDLLDIARITSGKVELKKDMVEVRRVLNLAIETTLPMIETAGHHLEVHISDESLVLCADSTRLAQVVSNLLNNAAKYTPRGGRVELSAHREADEVVIAVTDCGVGISPEALPKVFGMFMQDDRNKERAGGGLGVGLSLVRRLVELHGGTVAAQSPGIGKGSTFTVRLPLEREVSRKPTAIRAGAESEPASGLRILIVDDNADAASSLSLLLQLRGHTTQIAHGGPQALASAPLFAPQVVFLDIGMPLMNGYEVARQLRTMPGLEGALCVALTGWGTESDRMQSLEAGIDRHLTKPVDIADIDIVLSEFRRSSSATRSSETRVSSVGEI